MIPELKKKLYLLFAGGMLAIFTVAFILLAGANLRTLLAEEESSVNRQASIVTLLLENTNDEQVALMKWEDKYNFLFCLTDESDNTLYISTEEKTAGTVKDFMTAFGRAEVSEKVKPDDYSSQSGAFTFSSAGDTYYGVLCTIYKDGNYRTVAMIREKSSIFAFKGALTEYSIIWFIVFIFIMVLSKWLVERALKPAEEAEQKQKYFISASSHELRTPLAVILSSAELAEEDSACTGAMKTHINNIHSEASRMAGLVSDLLLLSSADSGKMTCSKKSVDIDSFIIMLYEKYLPLCAEKDIQLGIDTGTEAFPIVNTDEDRLSQIAGVLIDNASSYAPAHSEIMLKASVTNSAVEISVIDHGPGIEDKDKVHIFDRFYRVDDSRSDHSHFGLGLSVAKTLSDQLGFDLRVSDTSGGGSTFTISLPLNRASLY